MAQGIVAGAERHHLVRLVVTVEEDILVGARPFTSAWGIARILVVALCCAGSARAQLCAGDCNGDSEVTVDELLRVASIAIGTAPLGGCIEAEVTLDEQVTVEDIGYAIDAALNGCWISEPACRAPLSPYALSQLSIGLDPSFQMQPGDQRQLNVFALLCCYVPEPVGACVRWSITPESGVSLSADGMLQVSSDAVPGAVYQLTADVEGGRRTITKPLYVYTPESNPFAGRRWLELAELDCQGGPDILPARPIDELRFLADGRFSVTWQPFELYVDYSGTYSFDLQTGRLDLTVDWGNYVPEDIDPHGTFEVGLDGSLLLKDLWLGSPNSYPSPMPGPKNCGHRFVR